MTPHEAPAPWQTLPNAPAIGTVLGQRDALTDGAALLVNLPASESPAVRGSFSVLLLRSGERVSAFANRCAHMGVPLAVRQEHLIYVPHTSLSCNTHYARFRWDDGECEQGDCLGQHLWAIALTVDAQGCIRIADV